MTKSLSSQPKWVSKFVVSFLILVSVMLYSNLGRDALFDWDEGIYATLGSEMVQSGRIFIPTWNNEVWFEKPPGVAWVSAVGQVAAGHNPTGSRLLQPLFALGVLYMIYLLGRELYSWRVGLISMGLLAGFNLFLGRARGVNVDMPLLLGIASTCYLLLRRAKPVWVALAIALSIWFKGVAGLLTVIISAPLFLKTSYKYILHTAYYLLAFILPWHLYVYIAYGDTFLRPYLLEQVVARVTSPIEFHLESRWFYFAYLYENLGLGMILVATLGIAISLWSYIKSKDIRSLFAIWWILAPLAIFTLAKTRIFWYILPVYPAIALVIAVALDKLSIGIHAKKVLSMIAILICIRGLGLVYRSVEPEKKNAEIPPRIELVSALSSYNLHELAVLVPSSERTAEAILPTTQRISSSFRYGGMPSVVYYYNGHVKFFYNVDEFNEYWSSSTAPIGMISEADQDLITSSYEIIDKRLDLLGISKGLYAVR